MNAVTSTPRATPSIVARTLAGPKLTPSKPVIPSASEHSFGVDAILRTSTTAAHSTHTRSLTEVVAEWQAQITAENLTDVEVVHWRSPSEYGTAGLFLRTTDGALMLRSGAPRGFTARGWAMLVNLLMHETPGRPSGTANVLAWLSPENRSLAFEEVKARSVRQEDAKHPLFVRMYSPIGHNGIRAVRAVLSGRHSGIHFDDAAIASYLLKKFEGSAQAHVSRSTDATAGYLILDDAKTVGLAAALSFANSETGASSISFSGGARITAVGALVSVPEKKRAALIASARGSTRRAHTLPRVRVTEVERANIATTRLDHDVNAATDAAIALCSKWEAALVSFPSSFAAGALSGTGALPAEFGALAVDMILERSKLDVTEELRARLTSCVTTNEALAASGLARMSAAWVAATFALLGADETTAEGHKALADEAGRWVIDGW